MRIKVAIGTMRMVRKICPTLGPIHKGNDQGEAQIRKYTPSSRLG